MILDRLGDFAVRLVGLVRHGQVWRMFVDCRHVGNEALESLEGAILGDMRQLFRHLPAQLIELRDGIHRSPLFLFNAARVRVQTVAELVAVKNFFTMTTGPVTLRARSSKYPPGRVIDLERSCAGRNCHRSI
jgi:hypothetical protein